MQEECVELLQAEFDDVEVTGHALMSRVTWHALVLRAEWPMVP